MDQKRCEWCGSLSPADAEKCVLCRIAFGVPVPPPRDWSELTGNIPVITAPLLEEPRPAPAPVQVPASAPASVSGTTREHQGAPAGAPDAPAAAGVSQSAAASLKVPSARPAPEVTPPLAVAAVVTPAAATEAAPTSIPGWRPPDDPTLKVFAESLEARERRRSSRGGVTRRRRRLARFLVWLVGIALTTGSVVLAQARLPFL